MRVARSHHNVLDWNVQGNVKNWIQPEKHTMTNYKITIHKIPAMAPAGNILHLHKGHNR